MYETIFMKKLLFICFTVALCLYVNNSSSVRAEGDDHFAQEMSKFLEKDENVAKIGDALERYFVKKQREEQENQAKQESKAMEDQFNNPVQIDLGSSPIRGNKEAPITIVEFSDFQCPYCSAAAKTMEEVMKNYEGKVKIVFKNLPLPFHPEAKGAALAALAAGEQGKFYEMHDKLFANQQSLGEDLYPKLAGELGLDLEKFKADQKSDKLAKALDADQELATKLGVRGTPGFFVNGVQVKGARPFDYFKSVIDRWLEKTATKKS